MTVRLLPSDRFARLAYLWLVYLGSPLYFAFFGSSHDAVTMTATAAAIAVFLPMYFWGYWLHGPRTLVPIVVITAIAMLLAPFNYGSGVFFIYAGAFAFRVGPPRVAVQVLIGLELAVLLEYGLGGIDFVTFGFSAGINALVGGLTIYSADAGRKMLAANEESRRLAVVAERERIGRDLHDLLGHTLSVITLKAELASRLAGRDPERSIAEIRDVERISRDALAEVRRAVQGSGQEGGFPAELKQARTALDAAGVIAEFDVAPIALEPETSQTLAFLLREAVTNVIRHARATRCTIRLEAAGPDVRLSVRDDGIGAGKAEGSGLAGMRTRVTERGGLLVRECAHGTELTITLPLRNERPALPVSGAV